MSATMSDTKMSETNIVKDQIVDYMVLCSSNSKTENNRKDLRSKIRQAMANGWEPFGSVSIANTGQLLGTVVFAQAMVIYG
jgi:hypothetical protein